MVTINFFVAKILLKEFRQLITALKLNLPNSTRIAPVAFFYRIITRLRVNQVLISVPLLRLITRRSRKLRQKSPLRTPLIAQRLVRRYLSLVHSRGWWMMRLINNTARSFLHEFSHDPVG